MVFSLPRLRLSAMSNSAMAVSVWYGAVLRGDINFISIGEGSNLQDGVIGHLRMIFLSRVGQYVTVGHGAVIHACVIEDECLIGMNATILDGAVIGSQSIVAAGSVVPEGMQIPDGSLVAGVPATIRKPLSRDRRLGSGPGPRNTSRWPRLIKNASVVDQILRPPPSRAHGRIPPPRRRGRAGDETLRSIQRSSK